MAETDKEKEYFSWLDVNKRLAPALNTYTGDPFFGTSLWDQYRNANAGLEEIPGIYNDGLLGEGAVADSRRKVLESQLNSQKLNAVAGGITSGLGALTSIATTANSLGQIADTSGYYTQINNLAGVGSQGYSNAGQIAADYERVGGARVDPSYDDIRNMSTGRALFGIGSAALAGASAGMQIGGPWGAAIGGLIGAGGAALGLRSGKVSAEIEDNHLGTMADYATSVSQKNMGAGAEDQAQYTFRSGVSHHAARGGQIRRQQSLQEFADRVLKRKTLNDITHSSDIVRMHGEGGTIIRIQR